FGDDIFGMGGRGGRARGADVVAQVEIELTEAATGASRQVPFPVTVECATCSGSGAKPGTQPVTCATCAGRGRLQQVTRTVLGEFVRSQTCPACGGTGQVVEHPCLDCEGSGRTVEERTLDVDVPPGIHDGQQIRISGEGNDIFCSVDLTMTDAALGTTVTVPTLDGETELELGPGTQPGTLRVLKGRGMPVLQGFGRGDQRVLVNVQVPRRLNEEQRELLEEFDRTAGAETYEADEGFFQKLKSAFR